MVLAVTARAGGEQGHGCDLRGCAAATVVAECGRAGAGRRASRVTGATEAMGRAVRNIGGQGVCGDGDLRR